MPVVEVFGNWEVSSDGIFHSHSRYNYFVPIERLTEWGWCFHVARKSWADVGMFEQALQFARKKFHLPQPKRSDWTEWGKVG